MKKLILYLFFIAILGMGGGCSKSYNGTSTVVKPKNYHRFFNKKTDKHKKRTKIVKMKN